MRIDIDEGSDAVLDMAPLIDVVFLLLVFFMVATRFSREEQQMDLDLPKAQSGTEPVTPPQDLVIDVLPDGLRLAGAAISADELPSRLRAAAARDRLQPVTVRADRSLDYGRVIEVLDQCRLAGLSNAGLSTRQE